MLTDTLPEGLAARAPRPPDVEAIAELVRTYTLAVAGVADYTVDDARDELSEPSFDPDRDGRLVVDPVGQVVGYATASGKSDSDLVEIDVVTTDPAVSSWLFGWALDRAAEVGREGGRSRIMVDHGVYRSDEPLRAQATAHGFGVATTFHQMRVDHGGSVPVPRPPDGVVLRHAADPGVRRAAHEVLDAAFAEHFGYVPKPYQTWHESLDRKSIFDWSQLWVAELDGRAVGVLECNDRYVEDEGCGYVAALGVRPETRGRGIAKYLLRHAFATDANTGRTGTILHVDSDNTTPALGVYESVGMKPVLVIDVWRRAVNVCPD